MSSWAFRQSWGCCGGCGERWSLDDLRSTNETVYPLGLDALIIENLSEGVPEQQPVVDAVGASRRSGRRRRWAEGVWWGGDTAATGTTATLTSGT
jgi:hypothetical protein